MKMLRFPFGLAKMARIANDYIRGTAYVRGFISQRSQTEMVQT